MERLKVILRWTVGIAIAVYLLLALAINVPAVQSWLAGTVASALGAKLDTRVSIGRIQVGFDGRIIADDVAVDDRSGAQMLRVSRLGAKLDLWQLLEGRVRLGNVQLFGAKAELYQEAEETAPNFWFVVDAFASQDTTQSLPLDLRIGQLIVRRTSVRWEQRWKEETPGRLNPGHVSLANLNVTAELRALTDDSLSLRLRRLDAEELSSGLCVRQLRLEAETSREGVELSNLHLALPHSTVDASRVACGVDLGAKSVRDISLDIEGQVDSRDLAPLLPLAAGVEDKVSFLVKAHGTGDDITIDELTLSDDLLTAEAHLRGSVRNATRGTGQAVAEADILNLNINPAAIAQYTNAHILERLGDIRLSGPLALTADKVSATLSASTAYGDICIKGTVERGGDFGAEAFTDSLALGDLTGEPRLGMVAFRAEASGKPGGDLRVCADIPRLEYNGYAYRGIEFDGDIHPGQRYEGSLWLNDPNITLQGSGKIDPRRDIYALNVEVECLAPDELRLTTHFPATRFSGTLAMDVRGNMLDNIDGFVHIDDLRMDTEELSYKPGDIHITATHEGDEQQFRLISPFLEAQAQGRYKPRNLAGDIRHLLSIHAPSFIPVAAGEASGDEYCSLVARVYDTRPLRHILGIDISIDRPVVVEGAMDMETADIRLTARAPWLRYGKEDLKDISLHVEGHEKSLVSYVQLKRLMKGTYVGIGLEAMGLDDQLTARLYWDNNSEQVSMRGGVNIVSQFRKDSLGNYRTESEIQPSAIVTGENLWNVYPGAFSFHRGTLSVDSLALGNADHHLSVSGRASAEATDTLRASLRNIDLESIFSLFNFNAVELGGEATGEVYAHSLFSKPYVDARVHVPQVSLNGGVLGDLNMRGNWGTRDYSIYLDGDISNADKLSHVRGYVTPKTNVPYHGLDLGIEADSLNIYFLNKYTRAVFDDMQGHATGGVRLFGPFKGLNIEGGALVHDGSLGIPYLGVRYHVLNDSVLLTPGHISFRGADIYDPQGDPGKAGHRATVDGHMTHTNFSNMRYDIGIEGDNLLAYNFKEFGDMPFCGTVLATGSVKLSGSPGQVGIDIKARPQQGTAITYDFTSPDNAEQSQFITYVDRRHPHDTAETDDKPQSTTPTSDIRINFDLDIDKNSTMNLLMDARSGDMITVNGSGRILAHYHNKGDIQMFGTYRIDKGTYNLSLQEVIRKNFDLQEGGTIVFTGEPMNADINIRASHTVSGVSLNDISARSNFSNTSARVNCLMDITGKASQPRIAFDFDILNVNEDEKQMVRSLVSTEEERNMQVIYLLGIGRFYTYDYSNQTQSQSSTAMNSLLSSTLSGQLNQMLSNMINSSNWNFGANVNTGNTGWSDLDVEGVLQGSLLNDRLLINGNLGYRDNSVNSSSNFIGDFDAQYRLTRSGTVNLKAYNKTNDRYFTKSSLTTQGVGVLLKKDFLSLRDLFSRRAKKRKE